MFFSSWFDLGRIAMVGTLGYIALIVLLRISGKRTLAKMNMFDFVVTVALGSTLASLLLSKDVSLLEGIAGFSVLIFAQYTIAWLTVRSEGFQNLIKAEPSLLLHDGRCLPRIMRRERISRDELLAAVRAAGYTRLDEVGGVVLETDGSITVLPKASGAVYATVAPSPDRGAG